MKIRFYLQGYQDAKGESVVMCQYSHKSTKYRFSTQIKVKPEQWPIESNRLDEIELKIREIASGIADPIASKVKTEYERESGRRGFWDAWSEFEADHISELAFNTKKRYRTTSNDLEEYDKKTGIKLEPSPEFERGFRRFLKRKGNIDNTINRKLKDLKTFYNFCLERGWIQNMSYQKWKTELTKTERVLFLSESELDQLYNYEYRLNYHRKVVDLFRFHTETGLRYSDAQSGRMYVIDGMLHFENVKGKRSGAIKMTRIALEIWDKYQGLPSITNQKFNQFIKEAAKIAGIDSEVYLNGKIRQKWELITTHEGRATFITRLLNKGVPIHIVSKLVGHKSIKTTMIYDRTLKDDMMSYLDVLE